MLHKIPTSIDMIFMKDAQGWVEKKKTICFVPENKLNLDHFDSYQENIQYLKLIDAYNVGSLAIYPKQKISSD